MTWTTRALCWAALGLLLPAQVFAVTCRTDMFDGVRYDICDVDMAQDDLRLFLTAPGTGEPLGSFGNVNAMLGERGATLEFAMNAGMYHPDRRPVGLYVEDGQERAGLVTREGPGNFGLLPNGVFCIREGRADVIETRRYKREAPDCRDATQSGPMLVIDGKLHPKFLKDSDSLYLRNGVGTTADGGHAIFAISEAPVNFHSFARLFRDHLGVAQALYFDGNISRLYAPALGRDDIGFPMGPIVGTVTQAPPAQ